VCRVCDQLDRNDSVASNREPEGGTQLATRRPCESLGTVDHGGLCGSCAPREAFRYGGSATELPGELRRADGLPSSSHSHRGVVCPEHDIRVEDGEKRIEVTIARGGEECADNLALPGVIGAWRCIGSSDSPARG
jgi:hypothetical protein